MHDRLKDSLLRPEYRSAPMSRQIYSYCLCSRMTVERHSSISSTRVCPTDTNWYTIIHCCVQPDTEHEIPGKLCYDVVPVQFLDKARNVFRGLLESPYRSYIWGGVNMHAAENILRTRHRAIAATVASSLGSISLLTGIYGNSATAKAICAASGLVSIAIGAAL